MNSPSNPVRRVPRPADGEAGRVGRRGTRWAAVALVVGLGLNGISLCLCPPPVGPCGPESCCSQGGGHHLDVPEPVSGASAHSAPCCVSQLVTSGLAARIGDRDVLSDTFNAVAVISVSPTARVIGSTLGPSASRLHPFAPPLRTVLRM